MRAPLMVDFSLPLRVRTCVQGSVAEVRIAMANEATSGEQFIKPLTQMCTILEKSVLLSPPSLFCCHQ